MKKLSREMLAYVAGLYEGEGTMNATHAKGRSSRQRRVWVSIRMTDIEPLNIVHETTHLGKVRGPYHHPVLESGNRRKDTYTWSINSFEESQAFMAMIWEWLGPRRKAQAEKAFREIAADVVRPDRIRKVRRTVRKPCQESCCGDEE